MLSFFVLLLDQLTKFLVMKNMQVSDSLVVIPHFFHIHYIQNRGAAWGMLQGETLFLALLSAGALILLNQYLSKQNRFSKLSIVSYGLLIGGMIGNLLDRILNHFVVDFLDFTILGYDFPVFNLADIGIVVGIFLLVFELLKEELYDKRKC